MVFYSFYTDRSKNIANLHYRTEDESGMSKFQSNLKFFDNKLEAEADFRKLLWDNEDYRTGEYFDTEKKVKGEKKQKPVEVVKETPSYKILPSDYKLELNKVYNLDCMIFMATVPDKFFDYVFTSPPYNAGVRTSHGKNNAIYADDENMYNMYEDAMTNDDYEIWLFGIIDELLRITKKHIFFNIQRLGNNKKTVDKIFWKYGKYLKEVFIWNKTIASPHINKKIVTSAFEYIFCFSNDEPDKRSFNDGNFDGKFRNVITGVNSSQNKHRTLNKATFPLYLPRTFVKNFGKKKDIWFDPFNGTGTTFHACELEGRDYVGTEIDNNQVDVSEDRVEMEKGKLKIDFPDAIECLGGEECEAMEIEPGHMVCERCNII